MDSKSEQPQPDGGDRRSARPRVEIIGGTAAIAKAFQGVNTKQLQWPRFDSLAEALRTSAGDMRPLRGLGVPAPQGQALAKALANFKAPPKLDLAAFTTVKAPKIDYGGMLPRIEPLEMPKAVRPIEDIRLEAIAVAVNRLIDVAEKQNEVLVALDAAMEERHAETESHADDRAARADNTGPRGA
jgi:hypothetical protein